VGQRSSADNSLVVYGIEQEKSDLRVHVSVMGRCVYIYPTQNAIERIKAYKYPKGSAFTNGQKTGLGYLVPPHDIPGVRTIDVPDEILAQINFDPRDNTSMKGNKAVSVVRTLLLRGLFPLDSVSEIVEEKDMQISGWDITVKLNFRIQVKCDWKCGLGDGCTGNLFIQIAERNPNKMF